MATASSPARPRDPVDLICEGLAGPGFAAVDDFFADDVLRRQRRDALTTKLAGGFRHAGVGRGDSFRIQPDVRRDLVRWLDPASCSAAAAAVFAALDGLRVQLNRRLYLGLRSFEGHLAFYPPGAFYGRHVDRFRDAPHRMVSVVLYLNPAWRPAWGGQLVLHPPEGPAKPPADPLVEAPPEPPAPPLATIQPLWGRLACFLSDGMPHEVLPTQRPRLSLTGWFRDVPA